MSAAEAEAPMPDDRWPLWKTTAFVVAYCGFAWTLIGAAIWAIFR